MKTYVKVCRYCGAIRHEPKCSRTFSAVRVLGFCGLFSALFTATGYVSMIQLAGILMAIANLYALIKGEYK